MIRWLLPANPKYCAECDTFVADGIFVDPKGIKLTLPLCSRCAFKRHGIFLFSPLDTED